MSQDDNNLENEVRELGERMDRLESRQKDLRHRISTGVGYLWNLSQAISFEDFKRRLQKLISHFRGVDEGGDDRAE
jgi:hypothetical protein